MTERERRAIAAPPVLDDLGDPDLREVIRLLDEGVHDPDIKLSLYLQYLALLGDTAEYRTEHAKTMKKRRRYAIARALRDELRHAVPARGLASAIREAWHARKLENPVPSIRTIERALEENDTT